ncbi:MAG: M48 family metallopeptidase [Prevotellaceae bacterium]|nr:M48 family metallopeptidase [Prevotellaceae bacterium]
MNFYFYLILGILILDFLIERGLSWLNMRNVNPHLPDALKGIYDSEKYARQQQYFKTNQRFGLITGTFSFVVMLLMLLLGGFGWLDGIVSSWTGNEILRALLFFGILSFANDIISLPFSIYATFVIEEKFGFNKVTPKLFVTDMLKGWGLTAVMGGGILALIIWFYELTPEHFWLWAWAVLAAFSIFMNMFYSTLIVPLFNKQTPLEDGELRDAISAFAQKAGFQLDNIFVIDGSKRSTKANAYFSGLGSKKRIVLYDTLIQDLTTEEIVAVLAHEIGHYKHKHTLAMLGVSLVNSGLLLYILSLFMGNDNLALGLGGEQSSFHLNFIGFVMLYSPISMLLNIGVNVFSRRNEYQADSFAADFGLSDSLIGALKKLSVKSLSNLLPHPAYIFVYYSHPSLLQRLKKLKK